VDISRYSPDASYKEDNRLLFVGRMNVGKGVDVLLNSMKKILEEAPDALLDLVGDDEEEQMFQRQARSLGIEDRVVFHGIVPHQRISDYYAKASVVVLPASWIENSPLVVLEAMASGRPVVAGRIGGIPEIVIDGETGLLCNPGDSLDFEAKILTLLRDKELAGQMGIRARKRIEQHFSVQDHLRGYFDILKEVSGEASHELNQFSSGNDYLRSLNSNPKRDFERL
jgi:glycosyltransferase involved in cell wall biosynthesis